MAGLKRVDFIQLFYLLILCYLLYIHFSYKSCLKNDNFAFQPEKRKFVGKKNFSHNQEMPHIAVESHSGNSLSSIQERISDKMDKYRHVTKPSNSSLKRHETKNPEVHTSAEGRTQGKMTIINRMWWSWTNWYWWYIPQCDMIQKHLSNEN